MAAMPQPNDARASFDPLITVLALWIAGSSQEIPVKIRAVNGDMAVGADRVLVEAWRPDRTEAEVELGHQRMTAEAEFTDALMGQQVAVRATVSHMAAAAALHP